MSEIASNLLNNPANPNIIKKFLMNDEARYSITRPFEASQVSDFIIFKNTSCKNYDTMTILDATAGVGGDSINFSRLFKQVISIEQNTDTYKLLCENIKIFNKKNISSYNIDFIEVVKDATNNPAKYEHIDVIYIDAPWNGVDYKKKKEINLYISHIRLQDIVKKIKLILPEVSIFIKVPLNICLKDYNIIDQATILNKKGAESFKVLFVK